MKLKHLALVIQFFLWSEATAQKVDTLFYQGNSALEFRYLPGSQSISNEIYRICQLDSGLFDELNIKFQILKDGYVRDIQITGDLSNYNPNDLKDRLILEKLFRRVNTNTIVYYSSHLRGNIKSTVENNSDSKHTFIEPPLTNKNLEDINQNVVKAIKQHFHTTEKKVKTFIQLKLEVNKPINSLKIRKGTSHLSDQIIADLIAKEVFSNEDYIYRVNRATPGMRKSIELMLQITTPAISQDSIELPFKLPYHPQNRLKRKTQYDGINLRSSDVRSYIYDSSLVKISEVEYFYNEYHQANLIKNTYRKYDSVITTVDSIVYHEVDSVSIINTESGQRQNKKLFNQPNIILDLSLNKKSSFTYGNDSYLFLKSEGRIVNHESKQKYTSDFKVREKIERSNYHYDSSGRMSMMVQGKSKSKTTYTYYDGGYVEIWSGGAWSDQNYYYFDENGYLIAHIDVSDTQPYVTKYEYESGWGNATLFENNRLIEPRIY